MKPNPNCDREPIGIHGPWRWLKRCARFHRVLLRGAYQRGECPVCERRTVFVRLGDNPREDRLCFRCLSKPRWRALIAVLERQVPDWRDRRLFEASPSGPASLKLRQQCRHYTGGHFLPNVARGTWQGGFRSEDLEALTFSDGSMDLVVSQDVMEHIPRPEKAFAEIARILAPGGVHVFTVPFFSDRPTVKRVSVEGNRLEYLLEKQYHGNPIDGAGSLVITDWGSDIGDWIARASGLSTALIQFNEDREGLAGETVVLSRKESPAALSSKGAAGT